ncbi:MAG: MATE family efflux transporter [Pseudomonadota bacterium]
MWPTLLALVLRSYLSALEHTGIVLWVALGTLILNIGVNYILIFGNLGAPELGLKGAAVASLAVAITSFATFVWYIQHHFADHDLFARFWRVDTAALGQLVRMAVPISATALAESGLFAASALMMGAMGIIALASHGIVLQLAALTFMVHMGLSQAATVRSGQAFARGDGPALHITAGAAMVLSGAVSCVVILGFLGIPETFVLVFLDQTDPKAADILALGVILLAIAAAFQFVDGAQVMGLGVLRGMQDTKIPMVMACIAYWIVGAPIGYILGFHTDLGPAGVWCGLVVGLALAAVLLWARFWQFQRKAYGL